MLEEKYPGITSWIGRIGVLTVLVLAVCIACMCLLQWRRRCGKLTAIERIPFYLKTFLFHKENMLEKRNALRKAERYEEEDSVIYECRCEYIEARFLYLRFRYHPKHYNRLTALLRGKGDLLWLEKNKLFISQVKYGKWHQELYEKIDRLVHKQQVLD